MSSIDPLRCGKCGDLRVVYYLKIQGRHAVLKLVCPRDRTRRPLRLPLETRDQWIHVVAEQIYRCTICGIPISEPVKVTREGRWVVLHLECPEHGFRESKRHVLDTLYPVIQNLHQNQIGRPSFAPPTAAYPPPPHPAAAYPPPPSTAYPPPPPPDFAPSMPPSSPSKVTFCPECGASLQPGALFCVQCGAEVNEDDYET